MSEEQIQTECLRCGTCCNKGGPTLHLDDAELVARGVIPVSTLITLRSGEPVLDPVRRVLISCETDVLRVRGPKGFAGCVFLVEENECSIYESRPAECRNLNCWEPDDLMAMYDKDRLARLDMLDPEGATAALVREYDAMADPAEVASLAEAVHEGDPEAAERLAGISMRADGFRATVAERAGLDSQTLDFLFGRGMKEVLRGFGLRLENREGRAVAAADPGLVNPFAAAEASDSREEK